LAADFLIVLWRATADGTVDRRRGIAGICREDVVRFRKISDGFYGGISKVASKNIHRNQLNVALIDE